MEEGFVKLYIKIGILYVPSVYERCRVHGTMSRKYQRRDGSLATSENRRHHAVSVLLDLRNMQIYLICVTHRDRATYDPSSSAAVTYTVSDPADAPASLSFGPSFMDIAATYGGDVTIGNA